MAARTSLYTSALKMPEWVFGGDYGDLSKVMNQRDVSYENVAQNEQQTQLNDFKIEDQQRQERMREILNDRMGASRPATIRDAYQQMIDSAYEAGDPVMAMDYEAKRQAYEESKVNKRRAELAGAIGLADNLGYDRINEMYPGVLSKDDYTRNQKRIKDGGVKSSDMVIAMNAQTGTKERIPWSEARKAQELGWEIDPSSARQEDILDGIERRKEEATAQAKGDGRSAIMRFLNPTAPIPAPSPTPTPVPQDGRGDRARQGPSVGDQVQKVIRNRSVRK